MWKDILLKGKHKWTINIRNNDQHQEMHIKAIMRKYFIVIKFEKF